MTSTKPKNKAQTGQAKKHSPGEGPSRADIVIYRAPDGTVQLDVRLEHESLWLNLNQMADLFGRDKSVISRHLHNIYKEGELEYGATVAEYATVQTEGERTVTRRVQFFNLDVIISVGYRVNSKRGTQFRIWATRVLRDHILKGYSVNEKRLRDLNQAVRLIAGFVEPKPGAGVGSARPDKASASRCRRTP